MSDLTAKERELENLLVIQKSSHDLLQYLSELGKEFHTLNENLLSVDTVMRNWSDVLSVMQSKDVPLVHGGLNLAQDRAQDQIKEVRSLKKVIMENFDGNTAAAHIGYALSDAAFIYPITPSSPMGEVVDVWASKGRKNCFNQPLSVRVMQSEGGAAGAVHGALSAGSLVTTFTASQGLLLMIPNMYKIAGELMPCVFHVAARALAGQALSIFGDHQDVMAARQTGFAFLSSHCVQECMDLALVSHLASLKSSIPFVHFFDGFRISHELSKISIINYGDILDLIDYEAIDAHRKRALNPQHPHIRGTSQAPDIYFQMCEAANKYYDRIPEIVEKAMEMVGKLTGRHYKLFDYFGAKDAERIVVAMGAGASVAEETVQYLLDHGEKIGVVKVHLYRPWSVKHFLAVIPKTVKAIAVLDRTKENGSFGEPLFTDVAATFQSLGDTRTIVGGRYGLGSKDFTPGMAKAVFDNLKLKEPKRNFTVGIDDDVTFTSLPMQAEISSVPSTTKQCMFYGLGSDGTVGANKNAIKIIGSSTDMYVQAYFAYDAHKSGGVTVSHLRFGPTPIKSLYLIQEADYIACHHPMYVFKYKCMLNSIKPGGTFVFNTALTLEDLEKELPAELKRVIAKRKVKFFVLNAVKVAKETGMGKMINNIMQAAFFKLSGVIPFEKAMSLFKGAMRASYIKKGDEVVKKNYAAVDKAIENLVEVKYPSSWADVVSEPVKVNPDEPDFVSNILQPVHGLEGDGLPVSIFEPGGVMPMGTTRYEKRGIALNVPIVDVDKCTQCNYCSFVCPHSCIRPFLMNEEEVAAAPNTFVSRKAKGGAEVQGLNYRIQVDPLDCTGCSICANTCPDEALTMIPLPDVVESETTHWDYALTLKQRGELFDRTTVKGSQYQQPLLEFPGACEGCGETPYVKLLTQLFGERMVIANATGCSSIWGGSAWIIPYTTNQKGQGPAWANSLFEDNAEYGFGMAMATITRRNQLASLMEDAMVEESLTLSDGLRSMMKEWLENRKDPKVCARIAEEMPGVLEKEVGNSLTLKQIHGMSDMLPKFSHWIFGGDGWAYDIGYGGLDHVMACGEDVNILVMDTEVYSNTGGQMSKSTPMSAIAKFASAGKRRQKKDLGMMAMSYGDVYVASCSMGGSFTQVIRSFVEGESYPGPSLYLCYSPCIEHGMRTGLSKAQDEMKEAVNCGYWPLYRFNPLLEEKGENPFQLDCRKLKGDLMEFLKRENRFAILMRDKPDVADLLNRNLEKWAIARHADLKAKAMGPSLIDAYGDARASLTGGANRVLVLFATETGNTEEVANRLTVMLKERKYAAECLSMDDYEYENLPNESLVILLTSTAGQGALPKMGSEFHQWLCDASHPKDFLKQVKYAVFGLGDSSYAFFCKAAHLFDEKMEELGASRVCSVGYGDDQDDDKFETGLEEWLPEMWTEIGAPPAPEKGIPEPVFKVESGDAAAVSKDMIPSDASLVKISVNKQLTSESYNRDIRHFEFDLEGSGIKYSAGDALAIYPKNDPEAVGKFLKFYGLNGDDIVRITPTKDARDTRKLNAFKKSVAISTIFTELLDIFGRPSRRFYDSLIPFAVDEGEKEALKKLVSPDGKAALKDMTNESVTFADILQKFPSVHPSLDQLVSILPVIKPRYYSIASSQTLRPNSVHLCILIVEWSTPSGKNCIGTTTGYLRRCAVGDYIACIVKPSTYTRPASHKNPILMAGLGVGIAPFRAFIEERAKLKRDGVKDVGPVVLYFGARYRAHDFVYEDELEAYKKEGVLTELSVAFSRDQAYKVYVQNKIEENLSLFYRLFVEQEGYFYYCGQAGRVPIDVKNAIKRSMVEVGKMSEADARKMIDDCMINGRYNVEAW